MNVCSVNHWSQCKGGGAVAQKAKMLGSAPNVKILITSGLNHRVNLIIGLYVQNTELTL